MNAQRVIMLGPQRPQPNVAEALAMLKVDGRVALVTAGWQDAEAETAAELEGAVGRSTVNLALYERTERLFAGDPVLRDAHRERQGRIKELQRLYRIRLRHAVAAVNDLVQFKADPGVLKSQTRSAIAQIRTLDRHHQRRIARVHQEFDRSLPPETAAALQAGHSEISGLIASCGAILVAGGHVAVLLNRMRLFGLQHLLPSRPLIAWSAGAMAVSDRVVVFHDHAPQGRRAPELLDSGFGIQSGVLPLPDAARRLDWGDRPRLGLLARRFSPARCVTLDNQSLLSWEGGQIVHAEQVSRLDSGGRARALRAA